MAVHRAVVEVFAALAASRPLKKLPYLQPGALLDETSQVQILPTADGLGAVLRFPNNEVKQVVLQLSSSKTGASTIEVPGVATTEGLGVAAEEEAVISEHKPEFASVPQAYTIGSLKQSINSWGRAWYHISLAHPVIKFAVSYTSWMLVFCQACLRLLHSSLTTSVDCAQDCTSDRTTHFRSPHPQDTICRFPRDGAFQSATTQDVIRAACGGQKAH